MTIENTATRTGPLSGNGSSVLFTGLFRIHDATAVRVLGVDAEGVETEYALTTDYTVSGLGAAQFTVRFRSPPDTGISIYLVLNETLTQRLDLRTQGTFDAQTVEEALDRATNQSKTLSELIGRQLQIPETDTDIARTLPTAAERANKYLAFDASGNPIALSDTPSIVFDTPADLLETYRAARWRPSWALPSKDTIRSIGTGQSNMLGATPLPSGSSYPTFSADNQVWNNGLDTEGTGFVLAEFPELPFATGGDMSVWPLITEMIVQDLGKASESILSARGSTKVEEWGGVQGNRATHVFDFDAGSGGSFSVGEILSWDDGTGLIVSITDSGTTGNIGMVIRSGDEPVDNTALTGSGGKTASVNGDPTLQREQFRLLLKRWQATGWGAAVDLLAWAQGEGDFDTAEDDYTRSFLRFLDDCDGSGIIDSDTLILVLGPVDLDSIIGIDNRQDFPRKAGNNARLVAEDPRCVYVNSHNLTSEDGIHYDFSAIQALPDRVRQAVYGGQMILPDLMDMTTEAGRHGQARTRGLRIITDGSGTVTHNLKLREMLGQYHRIDARNNSVNLNLPDVAGSSDQLRLRTAYNFAIHVDQIDPSYVVRLRPQGQTLRFASGETSTSDYTLASQGRVFVEWDETQWHVTDIIESRGSSTPVFSCGTAGDLSVSYSTQILEWEADRNNGVIRLRGRLEFTPTFTTASGNVFVSGLPEQSADDASSGYVFEYQNISGSQQTIGARVESGSSLVRFRMSGDETSSGYLQISDFTSGAASKLHFAVEYRF